MLGFEPAIVRTGRFALLTELASPGLMEWNLFRPAILDDNAISAWLVFSAVVDGAAGRIARVIISAIIRVWVERLVL